MNKKLIIIDGPNNTGKSTLISKINGFNGVHYGKPYYINKTNVSPVEIIEYFKNSYDLIKNIDKLICDRSHLSEIVYSEIYRPYTTQNNLFIREYFNHYFRFLSESIDIYYYLILPENYNVFCNHSDDGELSTIKNEESLKKEIQLFEYYFNQSYFSNKKIFINDSSESFFKDKIEIILNDIS